MCKELRVLAAIAASIALPPVFSRCSQALLPGNALRTHSPASRCDGTNHAKWSYGWLPSIALSTCCNDEVVVLIILDVGVQLPLLREL